MAHCVACDHFVEPATFCTNCGERLFLEEEVSEESPDFSVPVEIRSYYSFGSTLMGAIFLCLFIMAFFTIISLGIKSIAIEYFLIAPWVLFFLPFLLYSRAQSKFSHYLLTGTSFSFFYKNKLKWELPLEEIKSIKMRGVDTDTGAGHFTIYLQEGRKLLDSMPDVRKLYQQLILFRSHRLQMLARTTTTKNNTVKCTQCNESLSEVAKFCGHCKTKVIRPALPAKEPVFVLRQLYHVDLSGKRNLRGHIATGIIAVPFFFFVLFFGLHFFFPLTKNFFMGCVAGAFIIHFIILWPRKKKPSGKAPVYGKETFTFYEDRVVQRDAMGKMEKTILYREVIRILPRQTVEQADFGVGNIVIRRNEFRGKHSRENDLKYNIHMPDIPDHREASKKIEALVDAIRRKNEGNYVSYDWT